MARRYLHSTPNPSFDKGGALAMELKFSLFAYSFFSNSVNKNYDCSRGVAELSASSVIVNYFNFRFINSAHAGILSV